MRVTLSLLVLLWAGCSNSGPGGAFCCLPCPDGKKANDAGTACE